MLWILSFFSCGIKNYTRHNSFHWTLPVLRSLFLYVSISPYIYVISFLDPSFDHLLWKKERAIIFNVCSVGVAWEILWHKNRTPLYVTAQIVLYCCMEIISRIDIIECHVMTLWTRAFIVFKGTVGYFHGTKKKKEKKKERHFH